VDTDITKVKDLHKNILIIYNPNAGRGRGERHALKLQKELGRLGISVGEIFRADGLANMREFHAANAGNMRGYSLAVIIGGDGTLGPNIDAMIKNGINVPIYAFGHGTANDFASYLRTGVSAKNAARIISTGVTASIDTLDVESANNVSGVRYAISDAAGGAFTNGVTKYNARGKRIFGKFAYLFKAAFQALTLKSQRMRFTAGNESFEADVFLFYILNTSSVGGLRGAGSIAHANDGLLDLVCLRRCGFFGKIGLLFNALFSRMHKSKRVIYRQGRSFTAEVVGTPIHNFTKTDVDGNAGGDYPMKVTVGPGVVFVTNRAEIK
jgi:diacylglycerol kinase (ATP)